MVSQDRNICDLPYIRRGLYSQYFDKQIHFCFKFKCCIIKKDYSFSSWVLQWCKKDAFLLFLATKIAKRIWNSGTAIWTFLRAEAASLRLYPGKEFLNIRPKNIGYSQSLKSATPDDQPVTGCSHVTTNE